jgi:hypothetical protein
MKHETCPDCGRKAVICINTMSKCRISPNNRNRVIIKACEIIRSKRKTTEH